MNVKIVNVHTMNLNACGRRIVHAFGLSGHSHDVCRRPVLCHYYICRDHDIVAPYVDFGFETRAVTCDARLPLDHDPVAFHLGDRRRSHIDRRLAVICQSHGIVASSLGCQTLQIHPFS